jgi:hypothetical protein
MPDLSTLSNVPARDPDAERPQAWEGTILDTPALYTDTVRAEGNDPERHFFDACGWMPRGLAKPQKGDPCVLVEDGDGEYRIVWWSRADAIPELSAGQGLVWDGSKWVVATSIKSGDAAGGALSGTYPNPALAVPTWQTVTYGANWRRLSNDAQFEVQVSKVGDRVLVRGVIERVTATFALPTTLCTLPVGFRPGRLAFAWTGWRDGGTGRGFANLYLNTSGVISFEAGANFSPGVTGAIGEYVFLDNIVFSTVA